MFHVGFHICRATPRIRHGIYGFHPPFMDPTVLYLDLVHLKGAKKWCQKSPSLSKFFSGRKTPTVEGAGKSIYIILVGGWTNPFWKNISQKWESSQIRVNIKNIWNILKPPPSHVCLPKEISDFRSHDYQTCRHVFLLVQEKSTNSKSLCNTLLPHTCFNNLRIQSPKEFSCINDRSTATWLNT